MISKLACEAPRQVPVHNLQPRPSSNQPCPTYAMGGRQAHAWAEKREAVHRTQGATGLEPQRDFKIKAQAQRTTPEAAVHVVTKVASQWPSRRPIGLNGPPVRLFERPAQDNIVKEKVVRLRGQRGKAQDRKRQCGCCGGGGRRSRGPVGGGGAVFLWWDRKNNPQENCWTWIKRPAE